MICTCRGQLEQTDHTHKSMVKVVVLYIKGGWGHCWKSREVVFSGTNGLYIAGRGEGRSKLVCLALVVGLLVVRVETNACLVGAISLLL